MWIAIALILVIAYIAAVYWSLGIYDEIIDEIKRGLDEDVHLGIESSHAGLIHDDQYETGSFKPVYLDDGQFIGFVREERDG